MGHRFSKTAANNIATTTTTAGQQQPTRASAAAAQELTNQTTNTLQQPITFANTTTTTRKIPIPNSNSNFVGPTINLQIQESPSGLASGGGGIGSTTCYNTSTTLAAAATGILQQSSNIGCGSSNSSSLTSVNNLSCGRQIIIKIQLAKMENGNELAASASTSSTSALQQDIPLENLAADCNLNSPELRTTTTATTTLGGGCGAAQILNLTLNNGNNVATNNAQRTAGSSSSLLSSSSAVATNNNYLNPSANNSSSSTNFATSSTDALRERLGRLNTLQFNDEIVEQNIGEIVEYCEVLEDQQHQPPLPSSVSCTGPPQVLAINEEPEIESNVCCRRKSKSLAANGGATSSSSKRRCRKCSCRDAFRRILDPSLSRSSNKAQKQQQLQQQQQQQQLLERERKEQKQSRAHDRHSIPNLPSNRNVNTQQQMQRNSMHSTTLANPTFVVPSTAATTVAAAGGGMATTSANHQQQVAVWGAATTTNGGDVIIPLTTPPQFVVVQCAIVNPASAANTHHHNTSSTVSNANLPNSIISITHNPSPSSSSTSSSSSPPSVMNNDIMVKVPHLSTIPSPPSQSTPTTAAIAGGGGPIVHSQVDFVHYLVPDLERITNSSFYWGKMDRYEAERLLEGKPEGTFLLRDSAQEEFLFSVTFRKYGRSLHARIEQSGHRFSFDCHDPCVYTAATVTGLLEHYKDPACVMFFEPMLTIPLHRKSCFSLQQLCRATIVSNTTYDGINELELPARLKSYLKEYHYKQKLRVKSNEPTYTIHCK